MRRLALLALAGLAACASKPPPNPAATACLQEAPAAKSSGDFNQRLISLKTRAAFFGSCMEARGYALDEAALEADQVHYEQVKYAEWLWGDPLLAMRLREQELRADPKFWRKADTLTPGQKSDTQVSPDWADK